MTIDILGIGEPLVEFNQGRDGDSRQWLQGYGGDTSNAVIAAARLGARAAYFTRLGDDEFGRMFHALWQREGVDDSAVQADPQAQTGLYFVTHGPQGHAFSYRRAGSAASLMRPADLDASLIGRARYLHVSGISQAISETACDTVQAAIGIARAAGTQVSYDPNLRLKLWPFERAAKVIVDTIAQVDLFLPSLEEAQQLSGLAEPADIVDWCHARGARQVVLKMGAEGAIASDGQRHTAIAPLRVDALDATGAGDCFDGALLARLCAGDALHEAARFAAAAAALSTLGYGAVDPLPRRDEVLAMCAKSQAASAPLNRSASITQES